MAKTPAHPFSIKVIISILGIIAIPLLALALTKSTENRSRASGVSSVCTRCGNTPCNQCSQTTDGKRCSCTGLGRQEVAVGNGLGYSSCVEIDDARCKSALRDFDWENNKPFGGAKRYCNSCSSTACNTCSKTAKGWYCNCTGSTKSGYTSCKGEQTAECGFVPSPTAASGTPSPTNKPRVSGDEGCKKNFCTANGCMWTCCTTKLVGTSSTTSCKSEVRDPVNN